MNLPYAECLAIVTPKTCVSRDVVKPMRRPLNKYHLATTLLSSATPLFLGYDLAVVYNTIVRAQGDLKLLACSVAVSSSLGMIAAVGAQRLIGYRRTVLLSAAALCAGAIARGLATGLAPFTAGVFVNGVGTGLALTAVPAYAAELSPSSARRVLAAHPEGLVYLGCILGSVVYSMGFLRIPARHAWRLIVAIGTVVPALLSSVVVFMPETPRLVVSRTLEDADEPRLLLGGKDVECGKPHDDGSDEPQPPLPVTKRGRWWREEVAILRELLVRPTEPLRRAVLTALVAKVFQQASSIGSVLQYVQQRVFRDVVGVSSRAALAVIVFVVSFPMSLVLVELGWLLVRALARGCRHGRRVPTGSVTVTVTVTPRQEQLKWVRGLSATMLLSLMALVWIALGPAPWAADASSRGCLRWLRAAAAAAVKESVISGKWSSQAS